MEIWLIWIPLFIILAVSTYSDLRTRIIYQKIIVIGLAYFLLVRLLSSPLPYYNYLIGVIVGAAPFYLFAIFTNGSIGGGDIKLMAVVGAALGWQLSLFMLAGIIIPAAIYIFVRNNIFKHNITVPLAPFFTLSGIVLFLMMYF